MLATPIWRQPSPSGSLISDIFTLKWMTVPCTVIQLHDIVVLSDVSILIFAPDAHSEPHTSPRRIIINSGIVQDDCDCSRNVGELAYPAFERSQSVRTSHFHLLSHP